jgi:hypothetical protein
VAFVVGLGGEAAQANNKNNHFYTTNSNISNSSIID